VGADNNVNVSPAVTFTLLSAPTRFSKTM